MNIQRPVEFFYSYLFLFVLYPKYSVMDHITEEEANGSCRILHAFKINQTWLLHSKTHTWIFKIVNCKSTTLVLTLPLNPRIW